MVNSTDTFEVLKLDKKKREKEKVSYSTDTFEVLKLPRYYYIIFINYIQPIHLKY